IKTRSQRGYDRLASVYQTIEQIVFGRQLQAARTALLDELPGWQRMLILGDGDGRLLKAITKGMSIDSSQMIVSVDHSVSMLNRQKQRVAGEPVSEQIEWIQTDALSFVPEPYSFDVIVTPFFLDCFTEEQLQAGLPKWVGGLHQKGQWYYVDFVVPKSGWKRLGAKCLSRIMHWFFRIMTGLPNRHLLDATDHLLQCGLVREHQTLGFGGMISTEIYKR
ncbi:unnamed protein product, partial [Hapterophycus canaliculatus]